MAWGVGESGSQQVFPVQNSFPWIPADAHKGKRAPIHPSTSFIPRKDPSVTGVRQGLPHHGGNSHLPILSPEGTALLPLRTSLMRQNPHRNNRQIGGFELQLLAAVLIPVPCEQVCRSKLMEGTFRVIFFLMFSLKTVSSSKIIRLLSSLMVWFPCNCLETWW